MVMFEPRSNKDLIAIVRKLIDQGDHDHDHQGHCLFDDVTDPALLRDVSAPASLMFSRLEPDAPAVGRPLQDDEADGRLLAALPLPAAHDNALRSTPWSWMYRPGALLEYRKVVPAKLGPGEPARTKPAHANPAPGP